MADKKDLDFIYSTIDKLFRLSIGEFGDFSGAKYDGDFTMTLEDAQRAKHRFIVDNLKIDRNSKVLDMGCGWGGVIKYITDTTGAQCTGLTLSEGQARACRKNGLNVYVKDCRTVKPEDFGKFDAITSLGAFEHFSSVEDYKEGRQEEVYRNFFKTVYDLLKPGGRLYLQTMVFGRKMIDYEDFDIKADKNSDAYVMALMEKQFPGSWLPYGQEMVEQTAVPFFSLISKSSGRLDYIETIRQWNKRFHKFSIRKLGLFLQLVPRYITDKEFRHKLTIFRSSPNKTCFERELFDHYRMVFEKAWDSEQ